MMMTMMMVMKLMMIMEIMMISHHFDFNVPLKAVLKKTEDPVVKQDLVEMDRCR